MQSNSSGVVPCEGLLYVLYTTPLQLSWENLTCTSAAIGCSDAPERLLLPDDTRFVFFLVAGMVAQQQQQQRQQASYNGCA